MTLARKNVSRYQNRNDTAANWTAANSTLLSGEVGVEQDTNRFKIGDGATPWNSLAYQGGGGGGGGFSLSTTNTGASGGGFGVDVSVS